MVKPITFIELVRAAYEAAPKKLAPKLVQRLFNTGTAVPQH